MGQSSVKKHTAEGSFSSSIKSELAGLKVRRYSDALSLLSAFTLAIGSLRFVKQSASWGVHYSLKSKEAIDLASKLISNHFGLECRISEVKHERLNAQYYELLAFGEGTNEFMLKTGLMTHDSNGERSFLSAVPQDVLKTETQSKMFVRGLFLACGMATQPEKAYHLEFVLSNEDLAKTLNEILSAHGIEPKRSKRKSSTVIYIKEGEKLEDLLAYIGASEAMMRVSNERIVKQAINKANRDVNCINANIVRSMDAAQKQIEDIELVLKTLAKNELSNELRAVAEKRAQNLEMTLSDLADELGIGRSAVNYRLKKLSNLAKRIRNGEEIN